MSVEHKPENISYIEIHYIDGSASHLPGGIFRDIAALKEILEALSLAKRYKEDLDRLLK